MLTNANTAVVMPVEDPTLLLKTLDALVRKDRGPAGFAAVVAIGVETSAGTRWWRAELGPRPRTDLSDHRPEGCDGLLILGGREAISILCTGALPPNPQVAVEGDPAPLLRLLERYTTPRSTFDLRVQQLKSARSPTRGRRR